MQTPSGPISGVHHHFKCDFSGFHQPDFDKGWRDNVVLQGPLWLGSMRLSIFSLFIFNCRFPLSTVLSHTWSAFFMSVYCISFHFLPAAIYPPRSIVCCIQLHVLPCHTHLYSHSILTAVGYYADLQYHSLHTAKLSQRHCEPIGWTRVTMARTREEKHFSKHQSVQLQLFFCGFCIRTLMIRLSLLLSLCLW